VYTDKKENKIFLIYKEIQSGAVAKSYMTNGLLIYGEIPHNDFATAGVFALFNSPDAPLYCKNDLVSSQNALSTEDFIFIWFLGNAETKFHISVTQWARKCYIA
jgi:hypothetical protein